MKAVAAVVAAELALRELAPADGVVCPECIERNPTIKELGVCPDCEELASPSLLLVAVVPPAVEVEVLALMATRGATTDTLTSRTSVIKLESF